MSARKIAESEALGSILNLAHSCHSDVTEPMDFMKFM